MKMKDSMDQMEFDRGNPQEDAPRRVQKRKKLNWKPVWFAVTAAVLAAAVVLFLNLFVWEINISGNKAVSSEEIMATLANSGLKTGTLRTAHDARKIEWNIMNDNKEIAWATVNIQGCCVNVVVSETRREAEMKYDDDKPVNIIAAKYGVIRKMDVFDGQGVVKVGDAVMKGDLLVSATFEDRHGKLTLKHSRARVMAV